MAEERDDQEFGETEGQSNQQQPTGQQGQQPTNSQSGQPIGGNDSESGSGTTMSQGSEFGGQRGAVLVA